MKRMCIAALWTAIVAPLCLQAQVNATGSFTGQVLDSSGATGFGSAVRRNLSLNGRNFSQLALLVPGTTAGPVGGIRQSAGGNETKRAGAEITTSGARETFNLFTIDGLDDRDQIQFALRLHW